MEFNDPDDNKEDFTRVFLTDSQKLEEEKKDFQSCYANNEQGNTPVEEDKDKDDGSVEKLDDSGEEEPIYIPGRGMDYNQSSSITPVYKASTVRSIPRIDVKQT